MELDIAGLETTGRDELLEHWRCLIGRPPPKHISRSLLIQILAWEQQSGLYGGFAWNAQRFKSLSHAARAITGYNVSGFQFFGVKP